MVLRAWAQSPEPRPRRIKAGSALLDGGEVECRRVGDRLQVVCRLEVGIRPRNGWKLSLSEAGNGLGKRIAEIGILGAAAVARPP
jgi:hypothetical protein